jgi:hypothetical protein
VVSRRAGHRCEYCRAPEVVFNFPFEVEHVVPSSRGGADDDSNLCLSCRACNLHKSDHLVFRDDVTGEQVALFNPREQRWADHFRVDLDSAEIHGTTATGRATLACLDLNTALQMSARHLWIRLRLFP